MRQRMCPNETCEHYKQPTGLLGGCDCGTALVAFSDEPTNEQLANLISVFSTSQTAGIAHIDPVSVEVAKAMLDASPQLRREWLARHRELHGRLSHVRG